MGKSQRKALYHVGEQESRLFSRLLILLLPIKIYFAKIFLPLYTIFWDEQALRLLAWSNHVPLR